MSLVSTPVVVARAAAPKKVQRKIQAKASAEGASKTAVAGALALTLLAQPALAQVQEISVIADGDKKAAAAFPALVATSPTGSSATRDRPPGPSLKKARTASTASPLGSLSAAGPSSIPPRPDSLAALSLCLMDVAGNAGGAVGSGGSGVGWDKVRRARRAAWCCYKKNTTSVN